MSWTLTANMIDPRPAPTLGDVPPTGASTKTRTPTRRIVRLMRLTLRLARTPNAAPPTESSEIWLPPKSSSTELPASSRPVSCCDPRADRGTPTVTERATSTSCRQGDPGWRCPCPLLRLLGTLGRRVCPLPRQAALVEDAFADSDGVLDLGGGGVGVIGRLRDHRATAVDVRRGNSTSLEMGRSRASPTPAACRLPPNRQCLDGSLFPPVFRS